MIKLSHSRTIPGRGPHHRFLAEEGILHFLGSGQLPCSKTPPWNGAASCHFHQHFLYIYCMPDLSLPSFTHISDPAGRSACIATALLPQPSCGGPGHREEWFLAPWKKHGPPASLLNGKLPWWLCNRETCLKSTDHQREQLPKKQPFI